MDLEGALLEGELQEERRALKQEEERLLELKERLLQTELKCREEREKVSSSEVFLMVFPHNSLVAVSVQDICLLEADHSLSSSN